MRPSPALAFAAAVLAFSPSSSAEGDVVRGATATFGYGSGAAGDTLMGQVGGAWAGLRPLGPHWLLQWDVLVAVEGGYLGNAHPFLFLLGPHLASWVEAGYRFDTKRRFGPYLGARLSGDASYLASPDVASLEDVNSVDGVGGPFARGAARLAVGSAYVDPARALLVTLFVQEAADGPEVHAPSRLFTEGGANVRFDLTRRLMSSVEGFCGVSAGRVDALRGTTDSVMRCAGSGLVRAVFHHGMWLGAAVTVEEDEHHVAYAGGAVFETKAPPEFRAMLSYGLPLWRSP